MLTAAKNDGSGAWAAVAVVSDSAPLVTVALGVQAERDQPPLYWSN
jgi:hypothetical protein